MAQHRHKRDTNARRTPRAVRIAGPVAVIATVSAVSLGVLSSAPQDSDVVAAATSSASAALSASGAASEATDSLVRRQATVSRSEVRSDRSRSRKAREKRRDRIAERRAAQARATARAVRRADTRLWTTTELNLWTGPTEDARQVGLLGALEKVLVTGRRAGGRAEIVLDGTSRWVTADYLSAEKPQEEPTLGGSCSNGTSVPSGVSPNIVKVHQAVCANYPSITGYGTFRGDGEHAQGRAVDIMVSGSLGWEIAEFLRANASALGIEYVIFSRNIWSVERGGEGWRGMSDRGSVTANHMDHVHVTTY